MQKKNLLYIIIDRESILKIRKNVSKVTKEVLKARPDFIQLRLKNISTKKTLEVALENLSRIKNHKDTKFIINDRVDISKASGADGVHLGKQDLPVLYARKILGKKAIIGKTVHSLKEAKESLKEPINYISIGPVFRTSLKPKLKPLGIKKTKRIIFELRKENRNINFFVIGGINLKNASLLVKENITNIAVASEVILNKSPKKVIKEFKKILSKWSPSA